MCIFNILIAWGLEQDTTVPRISLCVMCVGIGHKKKGSSAREEVVRYPLQDNIVSEHL